MPGTATPTERIELCCPNRATSRMSAPTSRPVGPRVERRALPDRAVACKERGGQLVPRGRWRECSSRKARCGTRSAAGPWHGDLRCLRCVPIECEREKRPGHRGWVSGSRRRLIIRDGSECGCGANQRSSSPAAPTPGARPVLSCARPARPRIAPLFGRHHFQSQSVTSQSIVPRTPADRPHSRVLKAASCHRPSFLTATISESRRARVAPATHDHACIIRRGVGATNRTVRPPDECPQVRLEKRIVEARDSSRPWKRVSNAEIRLRERRRECPPLPAPASMVACTMRDPPHRRDVLDAMDFIGYLL